jgi:hypothetical protein
MIVCKSARNSWLMFPRIVVLNLYRGNTSLLRENSHTCNPVASHQGEHHAIVLRAFNSPAYRL